MSNRKFRIVFVGVVFVVFVVSFMAAAFVDNLAIKTLCQIVSFLAGLSLWGHSLLSISEINSLQEIVDSEDYDWKAYSSCLDCCKEDLLGVGLSGISSFDDQRRGAPSGFSGVALVGEDAIAGMTVSDGIKGPLPRLNLNGGNSIPILGSGIERARGVGPDTSVADAAIEALVEGDGGAIGKVGELVKFPTDEIGDEKI
jgi:hypothetical protein